MAVTDVRVSEVVSIDGEPDDDSFSTRVLPVPGGFVSTRTKYVKSRPEDDPGDVRHDSLLFKFEL